MRMKSINKTMTTEEEVTLRGRRYRFCFTHRPDDTYCKVTYSAWRLSRYSWGSRWERIPAITRAEERRYPKLAAAYGHNRAEELARSYGHLANLGHGSGGAR
jgi:hypothetical protein